MQPHGGYRSLRSYQTAEIIYDLTVRFCNEFIHTTYGSNKSYKAYTRTHDQMVQAARSGKQNIAEGSSASGASKKTEIKLISVARASLEELLEDYKDFLRQNSLDLWDKTDPRILEIRSLAYRTNRSYKTYMSYMHDAEPAANCLVCLISQANYLLDRQLAVLEKEFIKKGDYEESLRNQRKDEAKRQLLDPGPTYEDFLNEHGFKKLPDGKIVEDQ